MERKFEQGWDELRKETLARQLQSGIVPQGTKLAPKPAAIKDWATLSLEEKKLFAHQAEVFAAYLDYTDHEIGRLLDAVKETGESDNTLVLYIAGDNGTSGEGSQNGMFNEYTYFNGIQETVPEMLELMDVWGGPMTFPHMAAGWSVAFDAPFGCMKQVASDFGDTRNGLVVHWPKGFKARNGIRTQFAHVIDVAPTILPVAGLPEPKIVNGTPQIPMQGVSLAYSFDDARAKERHTTQYFEIAGNRAIYHDGWFARTIHRAPLGTGAAAPHQGRQVGALRRAERLQPLDRRGDEALAEAGRAEGPLREGGREEPRPSARRPDARARQRRSGQAPRPDVGAAVPHPRRIPKLTIEIRGVDTEAEPAVKDGQREALKKMQ